MAQTNLLLPNTVIPNTSPGIDWLNPNNILLADASFAVSAGSTQVLTVGNFPINLQQGDTVTNIVVAVKGYRGSFNTTLSIFAVDDITGVTVSYPLLPTFQGFNGTSTLYTMPASLFATTWSVNQINNIKIKLIANGELYLDYVQVNVIYTPAATQTIDYGTLTGTFAVGDVVTGFTSGATATIVTDNGSNQMEVTNVSGVFLIGETITGVPSGAIAVIVDPTVSGLTVVDEFVQAQPFQLAQSMTSTDLFMFVNSFNYPDGTPIAYADFHGSAMLVIDQGIPGKEENVQITSVDQNYQGTNVVRLGFTTLSNRGLKFKYQYNSDPTLRQDHSGTAEVVISNNAPFYSRFLKVAQIDALISAPITIKDEGVTKTTALHTMNFIGAGVTASLASPNVITVNIPGGGGGGLTLQTNGVANGSQTLLNLVAGTNMTLTDNGTGSITFASSGGGGGGSAITFSVTQAAHGLIVGNVIKSSGVAGAYAKAKADSSVNAEVVGIVTAVADVNHFTYAKDSIEYSGAGIPAGTPGEAVFLDPTTAGAMTVTEPTTPGQISKPVGVLITSSAKMNFTSDYRGQNVQTTPVARLTYKNGTTTKNTADASVVQNIAHGLGGTPDKIKLTFMSPVGTASAPSGEAYAVYNGTTSSIIGYQFVNAASRDMNSSGNIKLYGPSTGDETNFQVGVITMDITNIIITWTKTGTLTGTYNILWEAEGAI